ncbi:MAG: hypothetical protein ACOCXH_06150 [Cyclobacteriaceae bacterium]
MKRVLMIAASLFLLSLAGCAYKTCPTYTQKVKKKQKQQVQVQMNNEYEVIKM